MFCCDVGLWLGIKVAHRHEEWPKICAIPGIQLEVGVHL